MADINKVLQELPAISEMLYQMYKDETDKENISVRYDQYIAVSDAIELLKGQKGLTLALEQANATINYLNEEKEWAIRDIDLYVADAEKDAETPSRTGKGYYVGLKHGLHIAKEIFQGTRNHG